jgi:hypothetical protein
MKIELTSDDLKSMADYAKATGRQDWFIDLMLKLIDERHSSGNVVLIPPTAKMAVKPG